MKNKTLNISLADYLLKLNEEREVHNSYYGDENEDARQAHINNYRDEDVFGYRTAGSKNKKTLEKEAAQKRAAKSSRGQKDLTDYEKKSTKGIKKATKPYGMADIQNGTVDAKDVDLSKVKVNGPKEVQKGKSADNNGTRGLWAVDPPKPEDEKAYSEIKKEELNKNSRMLISRLKGEGSDFFIQGDAGWGKTDVITHFAKMCGRTVITVYLDKAVPSDLGGIPAPVKDEQTGEEYCKFLLPSWVLEMLRHPETKYLLFFDEMNQAEGGVLNALMPIVLKHTICGIEFKQQFIVGAACNEHKQNESVDDVLESNKPLRDRFKPIIYWKSHDEESWAAAWAYLTKKYEDDLGKELLEEVKKITNYWNSPRDVERVILKWASRQKADGDFFETTEDIYEYLVQVIWDELDDGEKNSRDLQNSLKKLAETLYKWCDNGFKMPGEKEERKSRRSSKGTDQIEKYDKELFVDALEKGYINYSSENFEGGDDNYYLVTVENILDIFDPEVTHITKEVLDRIIEQMEANGKKPKYQTVKEGTKAAKENDWIIYQE